MKPIKKKIVFDKLRNYYKNRLSAYNDATLLEPEGPEYNNWGYFPVDIVMENENGEATQFDTLIEEKGPSYISETPYYETLVELEHTLPLNRFGFSLDENNETVVTKNLVLRYKVLEHRYYLIRKFLESLRFYWFCKKNGRYSWVEIKDKDAADFYFSNIAENKMAVLNTLPNIDYLDFCSEEVFSNISGHTEELTYGEMHVVVNNDNSLVKGIGFKCWNGVSWCDIIAVTSMRDEVWEIFKIGDKDYTEIFYYFADFLLNKDELIVENIRAISSIPYINMNLYVESESKAEGLLLPYLEEWEPNKKFYIGDTVKYKESGETEYSAYILTRSKDFEYVEVPESVYEASKNGALNDTDVRIRIIDDIPHFYRKEYYYKGYYDRVTKTTSFDTYDLNGEPMHWTKTSNLNKNIADSMVSSYSESRINEVLRYKKSFDEDGSVLPFIAIDNTMYSEMKYCLGNTKTKYYDDGQLYTNTLNSIKLSRLDKPTKENYVEVIAKPNEVSEIGKYDAYYIVDETASPININFVLGNGYSDKETHFLKIKNNFKEYEDVVFGREVKLYVGNKEKTLFMGENETPYINDKLIQNVNDEYIYFFVQFDSLLNTEEWYTKQAGIDFELVYDSVSPFNKITKGKEGLSTNPNSDYYKTLEGNNMIGFDYTLDRIANIDGNGFIEESGINMVEWHPYTISQYFCDYNGQYAWIKVDELDETIPIVETDAMPKASQANSKVYYCYTGEDVEKTANSGHTSYVVFEKDAVYRRVSVFYYIDIDYDRTYVYDEENGFLLVSSGMPITTFKPGVMHSNFEKVEGYTDESILGIVDIKSNIDAYIDRNPDFSSAFERHNILSEINTFLDLEHYKNNFFKL